MATSALAGQVDIAGPPGSASFGSQVLALPNGNFVVRDSGGWASPPSAAAVHLYSANGTLISTLTGTADDYVGMWIKSLGNGNFIVISPYWNQGRGAVTFVNGTTGLSGPVSADNSLVGSQENDHVGLVHIETGFDPPPIERNTVLGNGNYVVVSNMWGDGNKAQVGAVTWCSGTTGCTGPVTTANSLYGGSAYDHVGQGGIAVLSNDNYVVQSGEWKNPGDVAYVGANTWASGSSGVAGMVSPANSLVGSHAGDGFSYVVPLRNGNYVVAMPGWDNGALVDAGAAVWGNGSTGITGIVSSSNALVGAHGNDRVGFSVTALSNGHYVVCTPYLDVGSQVDIGLARWADGNTGATGTATPLLSLTGPASGKGPHHAIALSNGNYVVVSPGWDAGGAPNLGAVTWLNGSAGTWGSVSAANSLIGTSANDGVGSSVIALTNGNYVVASPNWDGVAQDTGAVTWADGNTGLVGSVSAANSLVGATAADQIGYAIMALRNGNYVVLSEWWDSPDATDVGAVTWGNGATGRVGTVSPANSLIGATMDDHVGGSWGTPLSNGNYVVGSYAADVGGHVDAGAVTWGDGSTGTVGTVSTANSLHGSANSDLIGAGGRFATPDGNYVIYSMSSANSFGAMTLGNGNSPIVGPITAANSVLGTIDHHGWMTFDYDAANHRLLVGRPDSNMVSLFTLDADGIFANGFDAK